MNAVSDQDRSQHSKYNGVREAAMKGHGLEISQKWSRKNIEVGNSLADSTPYQGAIPNFFAECRFAYGSAQD